MSEPVSLWGRLLTTTNQEAEALSDERRRLLEYWGEHPWHLLTGIDTTTKTKDFPDGVPVYWTTDESERDGRPVKPFPNKLYLRRLIELLLENEEVLIIKPRQMIVSTTVLGVILHNCLSKPSRRWLISKSKEDEAKKLIREKIRDPWSRAPKWLQEAWPISRMPQIEVECEASGSRIIGVAKNVALSEARGGSNTGVFVDEGCFQENTGEIWAAVGPATRYLWTVSTPYLGTIGGRDIKAVIDDGRHRKEIRT